MIFDLALIQKHKIKLKKLHGLSPTDPLDMDLDVTHIVVVDICTVLCVMCTVAKYEIVS